MTSTTRRSGQTLGLRLGLRLGLGLGLAAVLVACHGRVAKSPGDQAMFTDDHGLLTVPADSPLRTHLLVAPATGGDVAGVVELPGQVEADPTRVANVVTPLTGRVIALKARLGARVRRGEVLAVLASGDAAAAYADADKAADAADLAHKALDRATGVKAAGGAAEKDLEAARSAFAQAQAELTRARSRLAALNGVAAARSRDLVLTAPQDGVITTLALSLGQQITDPTAVLMTVANTERVFVTVNTPENEAGRFAAGADATIVLAADPDHPLHGKVSEADALLQPDTRRQKVRIGLPNPGGRLLPNMYATVGLARPSGGGGVTVPQSALLMNNDAITVLVEVRPWVFQRRPVKIADETETTARVVSGLVAGERVVVKGGVLLDD